jgi:hypothetical protein
MKPDNYCCRACGALGRYLWEGELLDFTAKYSECDVCGYVQTEHPYWLERAYSAAINSSNTGVMARNLVNSRIVLATLLVLGKLNGRIVDCAGGYGIMVRLLRDYGVDALWSDEYCENLLGRGFDHNGESAALVTAFEVFEHFVDPAEELDRLLSISPNVLLSTEIIPNPTPTQNQWWYYGQNHGQHIGFFRVRTLKKLAEQRGKCLISNGHSYHLITDASTSLLGWRVMIAANRLVPMLVKRVMKSKTWGDHLIIASKHSSDV